MSKRLIVIEGCQSGRRRSVPRGEDTKAQRGIHVENADVPGAHGMFLAFGGKQFTTRGKNLRRLRCTVLW